MANKPADRNAEAMDIVSDCVESFTILDGSLHYCVLSEGHDSAHRCICGVIDTGGYIEDKAIKLASQDYRDGAATGAHLMAKRIQQLEAWGIPIDHITIDRLARVIKNDFGGIVREDE
jgi:hypothetical protein